MQAVLSCHGFEGDMILQSWLDVTDSEIL